MVVGPGIPDVPGMIIGDDSAIDHPSQGIGPAMGSDVRKKWDGKGNAVDGVIEGNPDVGYVWQNPVHEGLELVAPVSSSSIVGKEHAVLFSQVFPEHAGLGLAQAYVLLTGHVDDRRAFPDWKIAQLDDLAGFRTLRNLVLGSQIVLHEHIQVGVDSLVPISAIVLQTNEAYLAPVRSSGETGPAPFPYPTV